MKPRLYRPITFPFPKITNMITHTGLSLQLKSIIKARLCLAEVFRRRWIAQQPCLQFHQNIAGHRPDSPRLAAQGSGAAIC